MTAVKEKSLHRQWPKAFSSECVVVTGFSGAGKTYALRALEDLGYFCVDNLPLPLLPSLIDYYRRFGPQKIKHLAVGVDVRTGTKGFGESLRSLRQKGLPTRVLFLEADEPSLLRRFSETRRKHPLGDSVLKGIRREKILLRALREGADWLVDSSHLTPAEMKSAVAKTLGVSLERHMTVTLMSFGYKYGVPPDADVVWDVRFLPNPNYEKALRNLTGRHPRVAAYALKNQSGQTFLKLFLPLLDHLRGSFSKQAKGYLTVAVGCTGGRHRSVAVAEVLYSHLRRQKSAKVDLVHRDAHRPIAFH